MPKNRGRGADRGLNKSPAEIDRELTPEQRADLELKLHPLIEEYLAALERRQSMKDARELALNLTDDVELQKAFPSYADFADKVWYWIQSTNRGKRDAQEVYDKVAQRLEGEKLDQLHYVFGVAGYGFNQPEDESPEPDQIPPPAPANVDPSPPPAVPATPDPVPAAFANAAPPTPPNNADAPPEPDEKWKSPAWNDPPLLKALEISRKRAPGGDGNAGDENNKIPFWIDFRDPARAIVKTPDGRVQVIANSGSFKFGKEDRYWHSGARKFVNKAEFDSLPKSNVPERPREATSEKEKQRQQAEREHARYQQEQAWYRQGLNQIAQRRQGIEREDHERAVAERRMRAGEVAQTIKPELVRELVAHDDSLKEVLGDRAPEDLTRNIQESIRALADHPEQLEQISEALKNLKSYTEGPYRRDIQAVATECADYGVDLNTFERTLRSTPRTEDQLSTISSKIASGYGIFRRALKKISFGLFFSGRAKARKLLEKNKPRYQAADAKLKNLSTSFGSLFDKDRLRAR